MPKKQFPIIFVVFLTLLLVVSACGKAPQAAEPSETLASAEIPEPVSIKIGYLPFISNTIFLIAEEEGYFDEQGLDVELILFKSSNELMPMLMAGEIDVIPPALNPAIFNAFSREGKSRIILPLTDFGIRDCSVATYLARKSDIDAGMYADKKDWINAKWVLSSMPVNSMPGYVLANALTPAGLSVDDIQIEMVELPAQEEALRNGQVDIVYAVEPWITRMTAKGDIVILDSAERYVPELSSSLVIAGPRIIDDPDVGRRFAIAYLKAVRQYMEGPTPRNVELAVELTGLAPELMEQICWSSSPVNGVVNTASLMDFQEWLLERGLVDELVSMEDIYEPAFAEYAVSVLGEAVP